MAAIKILKTHRKEPMVNFLEIRHSEDTGEIMVVYGGNLNILRKVLYEFNLQTLNFIERPVGTHTIIGP